MRTWLCLLLICISSVVYAEEFSISPLSAASEQLMKDKGVWKEGCPVSLDRLRLVKFSYYDFNNQMHDNGEIVVMDVVAQNVVTVLKELYYLKFPINKSLPLEYYDGDDEKSMEDNNTSCFNCRPITGGGPISIHSYGLAIDVNTIQNPYLSHKGTTGVVQVLPPSGVEYLNRAHIRPGMSETIRSIFSKNGFSVWGGSWDNPIDWQHFQPSRAVAQLLAVMTYGNGSKFFSMYVNEPKMFNAIDKNVDPKDNKFIGLYQAKPDVFIQALENNPAILTMDPNAAYEVLRKIIYGQ